MIAHPMGAAIDISPNKHYTLIVDEPKNVIRREFCERVNQPQDD